MAPNDKHPRKPKRLITVVIAAIIVFGLIRAIGNSSESTPIESTSTQAQEASQSATTSEDNGESTVESKSDSSETSPETTVEESYADDAVVNRFITDYNAYSSSPIVDIRQGNIRTKYYGRTYDRQIEVINGSDGMIHVTVSASVNYPDMADLREAFSDVVHVIDPNLTDDEIYAAYDAVVQGGYRVEDSQLGIVHFTWCPTVELSKGLSLGHFEIWA